MLSRPVGKDTALVGQCWEGYMIGGSVLGRRQDCWVNVGKDTALSGRCCEGCRIGGSMLGRIQDW